LSGQDFFTVISGDDSLRSRPMGRVVEPLALMGAKITGRDGGEHLPLAISGTSLAGLTYEMPVASAQVKSALLLAGLYAGEPVIVKEKRPTRDHTERMLEAFAAAIEIREGAVTLTGGSKLKAVSIDVPGDISSAAFFIVAALLTKNSRLNLKQVGMNSGRIGLLDVLKNMGARISYDNMSLKNKEPRADMLVESSQLKAAKIDKTSVPRLVDELPVFAVAATQAEGKSLITGAGELRVKETDRLRAVAENLAAMGADVSEKNDGLEITGPTRLKGARIKTYSDHRIAMAFIVAGLIAEGDTVIDDDSCIDISFPDFTRMLKSVAG
ncbi:MAG: 3-phosphoshikimate 1-carboxyvinyltransferase, partial [Actinomycetota bacterium]